jgi:hypothetical protein
LAIVLTVVVIVLTGVLAAGTPGRTLIEHRFDATAEGWLIAGDGGVNEPEFAAAGGAPGGCIVGIDDPVGETWYFRAPAGVLAHLPAAGHGTLSYSLKQSALDAGFPGDDVIIAGPGGRLSYRFDTPPGIDWTEFTVRLSASAGWRWNWNARATDEQIRRVLADPHRLEIRGEYRTGPDTGFLDNFVLKAGTPE